MLSTRRDNEDPLDACAWKNVALKQLYRSYRLCFLQCITEMNSLKAAPAQESVLNENLLQITV